MPLAAVAWALGDERKQRLLWFHTTICMPSGDGVIPLVGLRSYDARFPTPALLAAAPSRSQSLSHAWFAFFKRFSKKRETARSLEKSSTPTGLFCNTNMSAVSLFWNTNMAAAMAVKTLFSLTVC